MLFLDFEDSAIGVVERLRSLGSTDEQINRLTAWTARSAVIVPSPNVAANA